MRRGRRSRPPLAGGVEPQRTDSDRYAQNKCQKYFHRNILPKLTVPRNEVKWCRTGWDSPSAPVLLIMRDLNRAPADEFANQRIAGNDVVTLQLAPAHALHRVEE